MLPTAFYEQGSVTLAQDLLGCQLVHRSTAGETSGIIVETEAYRQDDEASHSFRGATPRNGVMFGRGGHAYVYFTYGVHYCFNVVAGLPGFGEGVLIRALEPTGGIALMQQRRKTNDLHNLCSGPGKLVQAMGLGLQFNGASLATPTLHIEKRSVVPLITVSPRVGISRATDKPWRFFIGENFFVSKHKFNNLGVRLDT